VFASVDSHWAFTALALLSIPLLVALNGFFVAAEFALVAIRRTRVEELAQLARIGSKSLLEAVDQLDRSVAACQLGITIASLALGGVAEPVLASVIHPLFANLPAHWQGAATHTLAIILTFGIITYLHVVFGELMPKIVSLQETERVGLWVAGPLNLFAKFTGPIIHLMNGSGMWFLRRLGFRASTHDGEVHSVNELRLLVEDTEEAGLLDADQASMLMNVFGLSDKKVSDILIPRDKISALDVNSPPDRVMDTVRLGAHTRLPVYDGTLDNIVGIVNTKDLFFLFSTAGLVVLEDAMYPAKFLPPDVPVGDAFRLFRKTHHPMAVVRDDDGKVLGLLTLEDVLEEIVGDIEDEHDVPVPKLNMQRRRPQGVATSRSVYVPRPSQAGK